VQLVLCHFFICLDLTNLLFSAVLQASFISLINKTAWSLNLIKVPYEAVLGICDISDDKSARLQVLRFSFCTICSSCIKRVCVCLTDCAFGFVLSVGGIGSADVANELCKARTIIFAGNKLEFVPDHKTSIAASEGRCGKRVDSGELFPRHNVFVFPLST